MEMMERTPAEVFSPGELIKDEIEARFKLFCEISHLEHAANADAREA